MRAVWTFFMIVGVIVCGGLAVLMAYVLYFGAEAQGSFSPRALAWPVVLILIAGACGAGIFMSPREFQETMKPDDDPEPAEWIKKMRAKDDAQE